jgi:selenocysteine lyase/cysteine desulfurase
MIFLNHAANGQMPDVTVQAITTYLHAEQQRSPHLAALDAAAELADLYPLLAELLHCQPSDIALTTGNSHGWSAVVAAMPWQAGDTVLITPGEWGGNVAMLHQLAQRHGIRVQALPCLADGSLDLNALATQLRTDATIRLVALTWVPANGSTIYPAEAVGALCAAHGVAYVVDAAQALGLLPVDVQRLQCDALTAPGRKWLNGPRGTGLLYVAPRFLPRLQPVVVDQFACPMTAQGPQLRADARRFESSESAISLKLGFKAALEFARSMGWARRQAAIAQSAQTLRHALDALPHVMVMEHASNPVSNPLVAFAVAGWHASDVQQALLQQGISVAVSGMGYTPLDMQARGLHSVVRASVSWQTTPQDIAALVTALNNLAVVAA